MIENFTRFSTLSTIVDFSTYLTRALSSLLSTAQLFNSRPTGRPVPDLARRGWCFFSCANQYSRFAPQNRLGRDPTISFAEPPGGARPHAQAPDQRSMPAVPLRPISVATKAGIDRYIWIGRLCVWLRRANSRQITLARLDCLYRCEAVVSPPIITSSSGCACGSVIGTKPPSPVLFGARGREQFIW